MITCHFGSIYSMTKIIQYVLYIKCEVVLKLDILQNINFHSNFSLLYHSGFVLFILFFHYTCVIEVSM